MWQLPAQIKKRSSKFWICNTFKNYLNYGTNFTFEKLRAINVLSFFLISRATHFDAIFFQNSKKNYAKIFIDRQPIDATYNIFFSLENLNFEKKKLMRQILTSPKNFKIWAHGHAPGRVLLKLVHKSYCYKLTGSFKAWILNITPLKSHMTTVLIAQNVAKALINDLFVYQFTQKPFVSSYFRLEDILPNYVVSKVGLTNSSDLGLRKT